MSDDDDLKLQDLNDQIDNLKSNVILHYDSKRIGLLNNWIKEWSIYISHEKGFNPTKMRSYNAGDIITINLGFNIGSEQGGHRPAIVIGRNNRSDKTIMVVPLGTVKNGEVRPFEHDLGIIEEFNDLTGSAVQSKAILNQLRVISKQRIISPKKHNESIVNVGKEKYAELIQAISSRFF